MVSTITLMVILIIVIYRKNRLRGNALIGGRSITDLARKGACSYRKACAYASDKCDMKKNEPKELGTTINDVIEYVCCQMYLNQIIKFDSEDEEDSKKVIELMYDMPSQDKKSDEE